MGNMKYRRKDKLAEPSRPQKILKKHRKKSSALNDKMYAIFGRDQAVAAIDFRVLQRQEKGLLCVL